MVMAALLLGLTSRLSGATQESQAAIRQAQAYLMMQAAAMRIYGNPDTTAGGGTGSLLISTYRMADSLGWYYVSSSGSGNYTVAAGGGPTQGRSLGAASGTMNSLFAMRSTYDKEVIFYFGVTTPAPNQLVFTRQAAPNSGDVRLRQTGTSAGSNAPTWP